MKRYSYLRGPPSALTHLIKLKVFTKADVVKQARPIKIAKLRKRCTLTEDPRGIIRDFKISRHMFHRLGMGGKIRGVSKSSW